MRDRLGERIDTLDLTAGTFHSFCTPNLLTTRVLKAHAEGIISTSRLMSY
jgi:hypothetical protein